MTIIIISLLLLASLLPQLTFTAHVNVGIVKGREAEPHSRPYMVSLQTCGYHTCGGFLIYDQFVLTAAHCWTGCELLTAVVGAHDLRNSISSDSIRVMSYIPHPNYTTNPVQNDIMLLRLEKKVKLNNNVGLITIPKEGENVEAGTPCSVAGWGDLETDGNGSHVLMEANTTIKHPDTCVSAWGTKFLDSQMICVEGGGGGSCRGDSGGPLVCEGKAVGVTSFGSPEHCSSDKLPEVYTKVSAFRQWIDKVLK
ncbi:mast cell protease 1A-like [Pseudorasbora parva]|uniref:mast cell protease 1A-like n=1 Tax=Pseudorasbora parva TaxID=51549 RepID=UPI00351E85E0